MLDAVAALPDHPVRGVAVFVPELHRYAVVRVREQLLAKAVGLFVLPFLRQEGFDGRAAAEEGAAVAPGRGGGVGLGYAGWVSEGEMSVCF